MQEFEKDILIEERTEQALARTRLAFDRTRLANKRTFLAWCRTALSFMTFGFLLEKIDAFLMTQHKSVSETLLSELGAMGKFAFIAGPLLILFAGHRFYTLEKGLGVKQPGRSIVPELVLMVVIIGAALGYVFS